MSKKSGRGVQTRQRILDALGAMEVERVGPNLITETLSQLLRDSEGNPIPKKTINNHIREYAMSKEIPLKGSSGFKLGDFYRQVKVCWQEEAPVRAFPDLRWLQHLASPGLVSEWVKRHKEELPLGYWAIDRIVVLHQFLGRVEGTSDAAGGYRPGEVRFNWVDEQILGRVEDLHTRWIEYRNHQEKLEKDGNPSNEMNKTKLSLRRYTQPLSDRFLDLFVALSDWHRVSSLNIAMEKGEISADYRNDIAPIRSEHGHGYTLESRLPNWLSIHAGVITEDNHVVMLKRSKTVSFDRGSIAASLGESLEQQDETPFSCYMRTAAKEELRVSVIPESIRLVGISIEVERNCILLHMVGRCLESSDQISPMILGVDKDEFDQFRPIWTMPLIPEVTVPLFFNGVEKWSPNARFQIMAALSYVHGFSLAMDMLSDGFKQYVGSK